MEDKIYLKSDGSFLRVSYNDNTKEITRFGKIIDFEDGGILLSKEQVLSMGVEISKDEDFELYMMYTVATAFHIQVEDMSKKTRHRDIVIARDTCFYIMRKKMMGTYISIGFKFRKDHATVMHGESVIKKILKDKKNIYHVIVKRLVEQFV